MSEDSMRSIALTVIVILPESEEVDKVFNEEVL
jgi:hypothetical protein